MTGSVFAFSLIDPAAAWLGGPEVLDVTLGRWFGLLVACAVGLLLGWLSAVPAQLVLRRVKARVPEVVWPEGFERGLTTPIGLLVATVTVRVAVNVLTFPEPPAGTISKACDIVLIATAALFVVRILMVVREYLRASLTRGVVDGSRARSITTRVTVPIRIVQFLTWVACAALICLQFQAVQNLGVSILASAGVAGVVLGLAAQKTVGNVFAGLQLAFAEQIRIGDTVVAEGEFGEVEEIGLTYVSLKSWDKHRLVLPVSYFVEKPFQNWTKGSPAVLGTVLIYTDFTVPVQELRAEFERILGGTGYFDGKSKALDVTNLTADKVELRALMSAADSGDLWKLQCLVRENLLTWLQTRGQQYIPIRRVGSVAGREPGTANGVLHAG
ncbi:mechanosensitive ion channel family protein [Limnoglobus roseus]|uniref:Putative MscS family protein YfkC n=1 Tax=Limnoglobus roseus TaxID=2598579 RepID=A0A5C1AI89_9BACT|nr:mechanosensitive ion channel domain-containing protein [Limnoglobus roseus]QEL16678.1 putative MscS family protein YfkC [Limnoglobus roseus]